MESHPNVEKRDVRMGHPLLVSGRLSPLCSPNLDRVSAINDFVSTGLGGRTTGGSRRACFAGIGDGISHGHVLLLRRARRVWAGDEFQETI